MIDYCDMFKTRWEGDYVISVPYLSQSGFSDSCYENRIFIHYCVRNSIYTLRTSLGLSDLFKVFEAADVWTRWTDTWNFVRMEGEHTICSVEWINKFSLICWNFRPDKFLVSHRFGIIRYMRFLQDISKIRGMRYAVEYPVQNFASSSGKEYRTTGAAEIPSP